MSAIPPPPPAFGPPTGPPAGSLPVRLRSVSGTGAATVILAAVVGASSALSGVSQFLSRDDARRFLDGQITEEEFLTSFSGAGGVGALGFFAWTGLVVLTMILMFQMAANLRALGRRTTWAPGWAIAGWFLPPGVLFVIPWLMFRELWKASGPSSPESAGLVGEENWRTENVHWSVNLWWACFGLVPLVIVGFLVAGLADSTWITEEEPDPAVLLAEQYWFSIASSIAIAVAAVAYIVMVRALVARHRLLRTGRP